MPARFLTGLYKALVLTHLLYHGEEFGGAPGLLVLVLLYLRAPSSPVLSQAHLSHLLGVPALEIFLLLQPPGIFPVL